ncbi:MAG: hypothetical protein Q9168_004217 [Polycauliona sp. 1 TL-2023]
MAGSSKHPFLLDFDEEELNLTIENSLRNSRSVREGENINWGDFLRHPDGLMGDDSNTMDPDWDLELPTHTTASNRFALARIPSLRPSQASDDIYETSTGRGMFAEESLHRSSAHAPHLLDVDLLTEMQALRARIDMLRPLISPPNQSTVLGNSQLEHEQLSSHQYGLDDLSTSPTAAWNDLSSESNPIPSWRQFSPRWPFQQPAADGHEAPLLGSRSFYQPRFRSRRRILAAHAHQRSNSASAQVETANSWAIANAEPQTDTSHPRQRTMLYYYMSLSGAKFVERQRISPISASHASKSTSDKPEVLHTGPAQRRQKFRLVSTASPPTVTQQSALPKRKRFMLATKISHMSEQSWLDGSNTVSGAKARDDLFPSQDLDLAASHHNDALLDSTFSTMLNYPVPPFSADANIVLLSQLLPKTFSPSRRLQILSTIRTKAPYVPLCVIALDASMTGQDCAKGDILDASSEQEPASEHPLGPDGAGWPTSVYLNGKHPRSLPVEIFELIGSFLPRDGIQSMRLVNREFESKISYLTFKFVVVPFKPKIYETASTQMSAISMGKQKESSKDIYSLRENHVKDGMRVFEQWGPKIKKFALTFEVDEETLTKLKPKRRFELTKTFWGSYRWPHKHYHRYEQAAKLEQKADETSAMTTAFSKLTGIRELGLSILSGLGWLSGRDASDRAKLLRRKPTVFGSKHTLPDRELREKIQAWDAITRLETAVSEGIEDKAARGFFHATKDMSPFAILPRLNFSNGCPGNMHIFPPIMFDNQNFEAQELSRTDGTREDEAVGTLAGAHTSSFQTSRILPCFLSSEQEDWLMEMKWAQEAFLSSWCIALLDNPSVFHSLRTFNIANISSQNLVSLQRDDLWRALPELQNLTVLVSPDWRRVSKDSQGNVFTEEVRPSSAQMIFWNFLSALFKDDTSNSIKTLTVGYLDGGEHATGMYARNQNILPAPIIQYPYLPTSKIAQRTLHLPALEEINLVNCWLTPTTFSSFFTANNAPKLKSATFDSVSLTANTIRKILPDENDNAYLLRSTDRTIKWLTTKHPVGSWPDMIDTISPGPTIAHARYIHGLLPSPPAPSSSNAPKGLASLHFRSCGYVRLINLKEFDQSSLPELPTGLPQCLKRRCAELARGMLCGKEDVLLGTVVPCMHDDEEGALQGVWGMELGWQGEWEGKGWECREDGQAEGGSGRFNGTVKRGIE